MDDVHRVPFWLVWNPNGYSMTQQLPSQAAAEVAAQRVAMNNAGQRFYVLMPTTEYVRDEISVMRFTNTEEYDK